jgi:hypothetical protein
MRDLFAPVAAPRRDNARADDARHRAAKAAHAVPLFGAPPSALRTMVAKAEQLAVEAEHDVRWRITARPTEPTTAQRRAALPPAIARKTDSGGLTIGAAELLARIVARWAVDREPVMLSPSTLAQATGITEEEAHRQIGELQAKGFILPVTDALGRAGWRPDPALTR